MSDLTPYEIIDAFLSLASGSLSEKLLHGLGRDQSLRAYAKQWFRHVSDEFRDEVMEELQSVMQKPSPFKCTFVDTTRGDRSFGDACLLQITGGGSGEEDEDDGGPPPLALKLLLSRQLNLVFFVVCAHNSSAVYRCLAIEADSLRAGARLRLTMPSSEVPLGKCCELISCQSALSRATAVCSIHRLTPAIRAALIDGERGDVGRVVPRPDGEPGPWREMSATDAEQQRLAKSLNEGQRGALNGMGGIATLVQGPPGTGKSHFITAACLARVPKGVRVLACTATNKAIDSLVEKLESAGVTEMLAVGSVERMGKAAGRFLMSERLRTHTLLEKEEGALRAATQARMEADMELRNLPKPKKGSGGNRGGKGGGRGGGGGKGGNGGGDGDAERPETTAADVQLVSATVGKLRQLPEEEQVKPAKKSNDVTKMLRLMVAHSMLADNNKDVGRLSTTGTELISAGQRFLDTAVVRPEAEVAAEAKAAKEEAAAAAKEQKVRTAMKHKLAAAVATEKAAKLAASEAKTEVRRRVWSDVQFVCCTASAALQVTQRLERDMAAEEKGDKKKGQGGAEEGAAASARLSFQVVVLDEAAAMLEPDAIGCLLHGAESVLLVGDPSQLPPFTK